MPLPYKVRGMDPFDQLQEQIRRNLGILPTPDFRSSVEETTPETQENDDRAFRLAGNVGPTKTDPPESATERFNRFGREASDPNYARTKTGEYLDEAYREAPETARAIGSMGGANNLGSSVLGGLFAAGTKGIQNTYENLRGTRLPDVAENVRDMANAFDFKNTALGAATPGHVSEAGFLSRPFAKGPTEAFPRGYTTHSIKYDGGFRANPTELVQEGHFDPSKRYAHDILGDFQGGHSAVDPDYANSFGGSYSPKIMLKPNVDRVLDLTTPNSAEDVARLYSVANRSQRASLKQLWKDDVAEKEAIANHPKYKVVNKVENKKAGVYTDPDVAQAKAAELTDLTQHYHKVEDNDPPPPEAIKMLKGEIPTKAQKQINQIAYEMVNNTSQDTENARRLADAVKYYDMGSHPSLAVVNPVDLRDTLGRLRGTGIIPHHRISGEIPLAGADGEQGVIYKREHFHHSELPPDVPFVFNHNQGDIGSDQFLKQQLPAVDALYGKAALKSNEADNRYSNAPQSVKTALQNFDEDRNSTVTFPNNTSSLYHGKTTSGDSMFFHTEQDAENALDDGLIIHYQAPAKQKVPITKAPTTSSNGPSDVFKANNVLKIEKFADSHSLTKSEAADLMWSGYNESDFTGPEKEDNAFKKWQDITASKAKIASGTVKSSGAVSVNPKDIAKKASQWNQPTVDSPLFNKAKSIVEDLHKTGMTESEIAKHMIQNETSITTSLTAGQWTKLHNHYESLNGNIKQQNVDKFLSQNGVLTSHQAELLYDHGYVPTDFKTESSALTKAEELQQNAPPSVKSMSPATAILNKFPKIGPVAAIKLAKKGYDADHFANESEAQDYADAIMAKSALPKKTDSSVYLNPDGTPKYNDRNNVPLPEVSPISSAKTKTNDEALGPHDYPDFGNHPDDNKEYGSQLGSNPGGIYHTEVGKNKYYVKKYSNEEQAFTEHLSNQIYKALGVPVPNTHVNSQGDLASEWLPGADKPIGSNLTKEQAREVLKGFAADAFLANWDAVGLGHDNIVVSNGKVHRIDQGGTLEYRAQGQKKPGDLTQVSELQSLLDKNADYKKIFKKAGYESIMDIPDIKEQMKRISDLNPKQNDWHQFVDNALIHSSGGFNDKLVKLLKARQEDIRQNLAVIEANSKKR